MRRSLAGASWGFLVVAGWACGPSPQPLPPPIGISISGLRVSEPQPGFVRLVGLTDAVSAADTIEVINLPADGDPLLERQEVAVATDGSFTVDFEGAITDLFRLQASAATGARTDPVDLRGVEVGALLEAPTIDCMVDDLDAEVALQQQQAGVEAVREFTITNQCGFEVQVSDAAILSSDGWLLDGLNKLPEGLLDGEELSLAILFDPPAPREETNVVVVEFFDGTTTERRLYTIRGLTP